MDIDCTWVGVIKVVLQWGWLQPYRGAKHHLLIQVHCYSSPLHGVTSGEMQLGKDHVHFLCNHVWA